ncbi:hypothetical protein L914_12895 [Phytophthora nicotianae]|uniref:Uncharacterized protein n=1 Tax=Phytophthora nicotianae TaxID=4792 RepID=W2N0B0_PHYNI|nr:hypothetical protein L914_12895 [Phytophthora nicotianae]
MLTWIVRHKASLVPTAFRESLQFDCSGDPTKDSILAALSSAPDNPPLDFRAVQAQHFLSWILSMKNKDGGYHSFSTYAGHRSALYNLFRDYHYTMSTQLERELSCHFKGLQHRIASAIGSGDGPIKVGKDPMTFGLYRSVAMEMMRSTSREMVFARAFLVLSWNLMSRSANTVSLCYNHMEWGEDALKVFFAYMKNDQRGTRPRDPRHIYANPLMPEVCPILALGLYWMVYGVDSNANQVFPGNDQYDRFRKTLRRALETPGLANELERVGVRCDDIGTHSMRKGAATYCSSGSTACPPAIAVHLRAGWALGGVQDRYLRHDLAGDMFVGRTVSGLPILKADFATLPPRFKGGQDQVEVAKRICFRGLPRNVTLIAEYALASIIYHYAYLKEHLPEEHPLFQAPLMRNEQRIQDLRTFVVCGETSSEETVTATGIPPHVVLLSEIQFLKNTVELQRLEQKNVAREVIDGVRLVLEEAADQRGTPSCSRIATTVLDCLKEGGYLHQHPDPQEQAEPEAVTDSTHSTNATFPLHTWGGGFHAFPEGMTLSEGTAEQAWVFCVVEIHHDLFLLIGD